MGKRPFTSDMSPLPDNLRCRRSDGRQWRCPQPVKPDFTFCEYHYLQVRRNQNNIKNANVEETASTTKPERRIFTAYSPMEKKKQRRRSRKDLPGGEGDKERESFDLKMNRNFSSPPYYLHHKPDDRGWPLSQRAITLPSSSNRRHFRCKLPNEEGNKVIDSKPRRKTCIVADLKPSAKSKIRRRLLPETRAKNSFKKTETDEDECDMKTAVPAEPKRLSIPDTLRCRRSDGRMWRCAQPSIPGLSFCEHHQMRGKRACSKTAKLDQRSDTLVYPRQYSKRCRPRVKEKLQAGDVMKSEQNEPVNANDLNNDDLLSSQEDDSKNVIEEREEKLEFIGGQQCNEKENNRSQEEASKSNRIPHFTDDLQPSIKDLSAPDHLRCRRSDGRKWRCPQLAMPSVGFCEYHHIQLRQNQGNKKNKKSSAIKRKLRRQLPRKELQEKRTKVSRKVKMDEGMEATNEGVRRNLPNGVMAISPAPARGLERASPGLNSKIGADYGLLFCRRFRSKNADLVPLEKKAQKLPFYRSAVGSKKKGCHSCGRWERKAERRTRCLSCWEFFCSTCIDNWHCKRSELKGKASHPICRGCCACINCTS